MSRTTVRMVAYPVSEGSQTFDFVVYVLLAEGDTFQVLTPARTSGAAENTEVRVNQWTRPYTQNFPPFKIPTQVLRYQTFDPEYVKHIKNFSEKSVPTLDYQFTFRLRGAGEVEVQPPSFAVNTEKVIPSPIKFKLKKRSALRGC